MKDLRVVIGTWNRYNSDDSCYFANVHCPNCGELWTLYNNWGDEVDEEMTCIKCMTKYKVRIAKV